MNQLIPSEAIRSRMDEVFRPLGKLSAALAQQSEVAKGLRAIKIPFPPRIDWPTKGLFVTQEELGSSRT